ncbi:MAG: O-methyltransferase [Thermodesulfobacteriota bacterium]
MKKFDSSIINTKIENYITELTIESDDILEEMHAYARESEIPIVGPLVGNFLYVISMITKSKSVFELGSGFGYSAYWFAKGVGSDGRIVCTDYSKEHMEKAHYFFKKTGQENMFEFVAGNSLEILDRTNEKFEIIFNDVDKEFYPDVIDIAYDKLIKGGFLITDNVLWYGRVIENDNLPSTRGVKDFNRTICEDPRFITSMLPLRDGVSISYKK